MNLITAAFPFVPAELNIAHFASTYVPADIQNRLMNCFGEESRLVCATDYHSIQASPDGKKMDVDLCRRYHLEYLQLFEKMGIQFSYYMTTEDPTHKNNVKRVFTELRDQGLIYAAEGEDRYCTACGCFLPRRYQQSEGQERCYFCHGHQLRSVYKRHYYMKLDLPAHRRLKFTEGLSQKDVQNMVQQLFNAPAEDWDITRYNELGVPVPGEEAQSFYIWFDSLVGYYSLAGQAGQRPEKIVHFIGKNIVYYHSVPWSVMAADLFEEQTRIDLSARGFLDFSKTDAEMLNLRELTGRYPADFIRFYLAFKVKDSMSDYYFTQKDFENIVSFYCGKRAGGFFYTVWKTLQENPAEIVPFENIDAKDTERFLSDIKKKICCNQVHEVLKQLLRYLESAYKRLKSRRREIVDSSAEKSKLLYETAVLQCLLSAYMPEIAAKYSVFEQWEPQTLEEARLYYDRSLKKEKEVVRLYDSPKHHE